MKAGPYTLYWSAGWGYWSIQLMVATTLGGDSDTQRTVIHALSVALVKNYATAGRAVKRSVSRVV
jgi:hypothetical protein